MAFQIQLTCTLPQVPRKTDPVIQSITNNDLEKFCELIKGRDINGRYPSEALNDDVTPLAAAVICKNEEICSYLLEESVDPNITSTNGLAPLHYATKKEVPLSIVKKILGAKADPDGNALHFLTPLQFAVDRDREDIVKALVEAGASPEINYGCNPELDKKVESMIHRLSLQSENFEKVQIFFSFFCAVTKQEQGKVFKIYREHFLKEHPFVHVILFEMYFGVTGPYANKYQKSAIKWLSATLITGTYSLREHISGLSKRFPRIPKKHSLIILNCLNGVLSVVKGISPKVFSELIQVLMNGVHHLSELPELDKSKENQIFCFLMLKILNNMIQKTSQISEHINYPVLEILYKGLIPLTPQVLLSGSAMLTSCLQELVSSLLSFTETLINAADKRMDDETKDKLLKLSRSLRHELPGTGVADYYCEELAAYSKSRGKKKRKYKKEIYKETQEGEHQDEEKQSFPGNAMPHIKESNSCAQPLTDPVESPTVPRRWHQISHRWRPKLEKLANIDASETYRLGNLTLVLSDDFKIAKGSDGTEVFLGLRDDGLEVAVKRMIKSNYKLLKNEEVYLRLPQLDSPSIVRYVDFAEDDSFGYLVLQLCEYTLEEYIEGHLPADNAKMADVLKKLVKGVLCSLKVIHSQETKVLHRDIKPQNVLIDITGNARLADFGISRQLNLGQTTLRTTNAGTKCWKAKEVIDVEGNRGYKRRSDIQVAGMLVYYILSRGHHPFGKDPFCEVNILQGNYSLEHLDDEVAKDLVEWMINENLQERPTVEQTLAHPFFWSDERRVEYLKKMGNQKEVENCRNADEELLHAIKKYTEEKTFSAWKTKLPLELIQKLDGKKKAYPENTLGLLRFVRNLYEHYLQDAEGINLMELFPDLFESVFRFGKERGWNSRQSLRKLFSSVPQI